MKQNIFIILIICFFYSCGKSANSKELEFVKSRAWVRSSPAGFSTIMFYFDSLSGEPFQLHKDTLLFFDGEIMGIINSVDTISEVLKLRSLNGLSSSNYKKMNRRR